MAGEPKILVWQWGRFGAGPRIAFELATAMRRHCGMDVLLSLSDSAELCASPICRDAVDLPVKTYDTTGQFAARTLMYRQHFPPLFSHLERNRPTVALSIMPGYWDVFMIRRLRRLGIPVVTIVHDAANHPGDRQQFIHWMQRIMIKESTAIITLTDFVAQCLRDQGRLAAQDHRTIAHPALTFPDLKLPTVHPPEYPERTPLRILLTGRLRKYKGIELFLQAISMIDPGRIEVRITGSVNDQALLARAEDLPHMQLQIGWLSEQTFVSQLDWSDVVVFPYMEASQSGIIPTAYGRRRPVIVTPVGGLPEQVGHEITGLVTGDLSAEAIAQAILRFLDTPDLLKSCADRAYQCAQKELSWQQVGRSFADYLSEISSR